LIVKTNKFNQMHSIIGFLAIAAAVITVCAIPAEAGNRGSATPVRFATFNASLNRFNAGDLASDLATPGSAQPDVIAEIIQRVRPDVLLINEFDYDSDGLSAQLFQDNYLSVPHGDAEPIVYPYRFVAPSNTGIPSGFDLSFPSTRIRCVPSSYSSGKTCRGHSCR
jgi:3-phytase